MISMDTLNAITGAVVGILGIIYVRRLEKKYIDDVEDDETDE